jgi:hypothetical protein
MIPRRAALWVLAALAFGLLVLPFLVYQTGIRVFGQYPKGGAGALFADYLQGLVTLQWYSWALALGPALIVLLWLVLVGTGTRTRRHPE